MSERVVVQELHLVRGLAGNEPSRRQRVVRTLRKWLLTREASSFEFTEHDFDRLWKGLFYCVWMSDKPLVQEELCENIASLFECFDRFSTSVLFYKSFLKTMAKDWFGIDQHRLDKFLMLVRRVTRGLLFSLKKHEWSVNATSELLTCLAREGGLFSVPTLSEYRMALGLQLHLVDCWMEEVAKVSEGKISSKVVTQLIEPFAYYLCNGQENRLCSNIMKNIFVHLLKQTDLGIEYTEKELAWRNAGYPGGSIDAMQKVTESDSDISEDEDKYDKIDEPQRKEALDPRAGFVDTILPQLCVNGKEIAMMLRDLVPESHTSCTNRTRIRELITNFEILASGKYPLTMKNIVLPTDSKFKLPKASKAAIDLLSYEKEVDEKNEEKELIGLNKRQKRRFLMKQRKKYLNQNEENKVNSDSDEPAKKKKKTTNHESSGIWHVEDIKDTKKNLVLADSSVTSRPKASEKIKKSNEKKKTNSHSHVNGCEDISEQTDSDQQNVNESNFDESDKQNSKVEICKNKKSHFNESLIDVKSNTSDSKKIELKDNFNVLNKLSTSTPLSSKSSTKINKSFEKINKSTPISKKIKSPKESKQTPKKITVSNKKEINGGETEITIPYKNPRSKSLQNKSDSDILKTKSVKTALTCNKLSSTMTPSKKVNIVLAKNTSHGVIDYFKIVKQSPENPFDGGKRPVRTSLKPNSMPSPVNPFYKHKLKLLA